VRNEGTGVQADVGSLRARIGLLLTRMGKQEPAALEFQRAVEIAEPITTARPNILEAQYVLADAHSGLGDVWQMRASNANSLPQRIHDCTEAQSSYRRSLEVWQRIHNPGARTPTGFACGSRKMVAERIAKCDGVLARLPR